MLWDDYDINKCSMNIYTNREKQIIAKNSFCDIT